MDLTSWIIDYTTYLHANGYKRHNIDVRINHLHCLNRFIEAKGLVSIEQFPQEWASDFIDYWMLCHPAASNRSGFKFKSRFEPHHHVSVQLSLRSFFRWAHDTGRLNKNIFPLRPPVAGNYSFPEIEGYLLFCKEHKGLSPSSLLQIERYICLFDQFLRSCGLTEWNQLQNCHIDGFVRRQASTTSGGFSSFMQC